jgi:hypothetical protein
MDQHGNTEQRRDEAFAPEEFENSYVFQFPYPVVDASFQNMLSLVREQVALKIDRQQITTGSTLYRFVFSSKNKRLSEIEIATVELRMVGHDLTLFRIHLGSDIEGANTPSLKALEDRYKAMITYLPGFFADILQDDQRYIAQLVEHHRKTPPPQDSTPPQANMWWSAIKALLPPEQPLTKIGRPPKTDNEWARQEIAAGRDREDVFQGYLERLKINPNDEPAKARAKDQFRKALTRMKGRK